MTRGTRARMSGRMIFSLYRYQVKIVPALPSRSESSTSKIAGVRGNGITAAAASLPFAASRRRRLAGRGRLGDARRGAGLGCGRGLLRLRGVAADGDGVRRLRRRGLGRRGRLPAALDLLRERGERVVRE